MLAIDPEDLQAHYNLMLCYSGLGEREAGETSIEERYLRFKADESSQAITGPYRQLHPEDNNERQAIHEHVSVPLRVRQEHVRQPPRQAQGTLSAVQPGKARLASGRIRNRSTRDAKVLL